MYNGKLVNSNFLIERIYRDFNLDWSINISDAIEWISEALSELKVPCFYVDKCTDGNIELGHQDYITIENGRGKLPCDLFSITQTAAVNTCENYQGTVRSYITGIAYCDINTGETCTTGDCSDLCCDLTCSQEDCNTCSTCNSTSDCSCNPCTTYYSYTPMRWNTSTFYKTYHGTNLDFLCNSDLTYTVNNNYIFTSFKEGKVCMAYKAIPTDEDGLPMIPDQQSVINYVTWYVGNKIAFQSWTMGKIADKVYEEYKAYMQLYYMKARNEGKMPKSLDEWQSYASQRLRTIPNYMEHKTFFRNLQRPERRIIHPSTRDLFSNGGSWIV